MGTKRSIKAMDRKNSCYTPEFKLKAVNYSREMKSIKEAARRFNVDGKRIRGWCEQEDSLRYLVLSGKKKMRRVGRKARNNKSLNIDELPEPDEEDNGIMMEHSNSLEDNLRNNHDTGGPPASKRERLEDAQSYYNEAAQGTSFGLNFVTYQEYQTLKIEHDSIKQQLANIKSSVLAEVQHTLFAQINAVKKENSQLKEEICQLKRRISDRGAGGRGDNGVVNGSCDVDNAKLADQVNRLSVELASVKASMNTQPPVPGPDTVSYMKALISYYDQKLAPKPPTVPPAVSTVPPPVPPPPPVPSLPPLPAAPLYQAPLASIPSTPSKQPDPHNGLATLPHPSPMSENTLPHTASFEDMNFNPASLRLPQKDSSSASDPSARPVLLVPGRDVWVDSKQLASVLHLTATRGGDDVAQFLLRRVVMLAFTVEELAYSRGQGIMSSTSLDTAHRRPLDPEKVAACKEFMKMWCAERNLEEPSEKATNTVITHQITYSRTKLKRMANKLKEADASANIPNLGTFDVSQYFPKDSEDDSASQFSIKEEVLDNDYSNANQNSNTE